MKVQQIQQEVGQPTSQIIHEMKTHLVGVGYRIGTRLFELRDKLTAIAVKQNRRTIESKMLLETQNDLDFILVDIRQVDNLFPELYNKIFQVAVDFKRGLYARALGRLVNLIRPMQAVPPVPQVTHQVGWLEEPPVLA